MIKEIVKGFLVLMALTLTGTALAQCPWGTHWDPWAGQCVNDAGNNVPPGGPGGPGGGMGPGACLWPNNGVWYPNGYKQHVNAKFQCSWGKWVVVSNPGGSNPWNWPKN